MQRRQDREDPGRRPARRRGHQLPSRAQPEHGMHAGALVDDHRTVRAHARGGRQRRAAAARRAEHRGLASRAGGLSHGAAGQGAFRAGPGLSGALVREPDGARELDRPLPRLRAHGARDARPARRMALLAVAAEEPSRGARRILAGALRSARRRHRRTRGQVQSDFARELSHRLGRRSHDRVSRLARPERELVCLDELSRPASPVGSARKGGAPDQLARSRSARGLSRIARQDRKDPRAEAAPLARLVRRAVRQLRGRAQHVRARRR